jgi:hypothetical protein
MATTNVSVPTIQRPGSAERPLKLLLRVVPSGERWSWRLLSRVGVSGRPRLFYADPKTFRTREEATEGGRAALAVADWTVSGPMAA